MAEATSVSSLAEAAFRRELVQYLDKILDTVGALKAEVPICFTKAVDNLDLEGRCIRLKDHLEKLSQSASVDLFQDDFRNFLRILQDLSSLLSTLNGSTFAPERAWVRWFRSGSGKFIKQLENVSNQLNDAIADHILNVNINLPDNEVSEEKNFPPTIDDMQLSRAVNNAEEEQEAPVLTFSANTRLCLQEPDKNTERFSIGTASTASLSSTSSPSNCFELDANSILSVDEAINATKVYWDFSPREIRQHKWWGSSSNVSRSRKDRIELCIKTQVLREMPQNIPVKELRVVLAQLEAGDTSPGIVAGKAAVSTIGALGALLVSPLVDLGGVSAKDAISHTGDSAGAVFSHYLVEFELENGTVGTIENCVEDVYLYAGRSSRPLQHVVSRIPMAPGSMGSPDSLTKSIYLRDLIRFRNEERQRPYRLLDNNCKHFTYNALTSGRLFPKAGNFEGDSTDAFFTVCQGCYVQKDSFPLFADYDFTLKVIEKLDFDDSLRAIADA